MAFVFATRPYGPESTPDEIQAMRDRVFVVEPGIIVLHELPVMSVFSVQTMSDRVFELIRQEGACGLVVDLTEAQPPIPEVRDVIRREVERALAQTRRHVLVTGKNFLINASAKFVMAAVFGFGRIGLRRTREEAIQEVRDALGHR